MISDLATHAIFPVWLLLKRALCDFLWLRFVLNKHTDTHDHTHRGTNTHTKRQMRNLKENKSENFHMRGFSYENIVCPKNILG